MITDGAFWGQMSTFLCKIEETRDPQVKGRPTCRKTVSLKTLTFSIFIYCFLSVSTFFVLFRFLTLRLKKNAQNEGVSQTFKDRGFLGGRSSRRLLSRWKQEIEQLKFKCIFCDKVVVKLNSFVIRQKESM